MPKFLLLCNNASARDGRKTTYALLITNAEDDKVTKIETIQLLEVNRPLKISLGQSISAFHRRYTMNMYTGEQL